MARPKSRATKKPAKKKTAGAEKRSAEREKNKGKIGRQRKGTGALRGDRKGEKPMRWRGRLTPAVADVLVDATRQLGTFDAAADVCGFPDSTVRRWLMKGREFWETLDEWIENTEAGIDAGPEPDPTKTPYPDFALRMYAAKTQFEIDAVKVIRGAVVTDKITKYDDSGKPIEQELVERPDWKAHAWMLERTNNRRWGRHAASLLAQNSDDPEGDNTDYNAAILLLVNQQKDRHDAAAGKGGGSK